jgi:hypothetical protein
MRAAPGEPARDLVGRAYRRRHAHRHQGRRESRRLHDDVQPRVVLADAARQVERVVQVSRREYRAQVRPPARSNGISCTRGLAEARAARSPRNPLARAGTRDASSSADTSAPITAASPAPAAAFKNRTARYRLSRSASPSDEYPSSAARAQSDSGEATPPATTHATEREVE